MLFRGEYYLRVEEALDGAIGQPGHQIEPLDSSIAPDVLLEELLGPDVRAFKECPEDLRERILGQRVEENHLPEHLPLHAADGIRPIVHRIVQYLLGGFPAHTLIDTQVGV